MRNRKWVPIPDKTPKAGRDVELLSGEGPAYMWKTKFARVVKRHGEGVKIEPYKGSLEGATHWRYVR